MQMKKSVAAAYTTLHSTYTSQVAIYCTRAMGESWQK